MRKVLLLALNDVRLVVRDRASLVWMLVMPLALTWFFGQMGGGTPGQTRVLITVVDHDRGWVARSLVEDLAGPGVEVVEIAPGEAEAAKSKVRTLVLPEGFTAKVLAGEQQKLQLVADDGANEDYSFAAQFHVVRAMARLLGRLVEMNGAAPLAGRAADPGAPDELRRLASRPKLVQLEVSTAGTGRPVPSGLAQSVPGILTMTVLMMTLIYGGVFLTLEKRDGTLRRQMTLPMSRAGILFGKLLGRLLVAAVQIAILVLAGLFLFRFSFGPSPAGLALLLTCYAGCVAGIAVFLGAVLATPEQASAVGWITSMLLSALGGCWWPSEVMPRWMWSAAHVLPTAWAMDGFHAMITFGRGIDGALLPSLVLLLFGGVFFALGARLLRAEAAP